MTTVDPAFKVINAKNLKSCFHIWRIENLQVVPVPKDSYGQFFQGDSYIILSHYNNPLPKGTPSGDPSKESKGALEQNIHFWLGKETSQDEAGAAAIKTVELDTHMGGAPVQYREVQGEESTEFTNYFKSIKGGIRYKKGGHASGFNHVEHKFTKSLLSVKGKRAVRVCEVDIDWSAMNHGDSYILDLNRVIFVWIGKDSNRVERLKAMEIARDLRDERGGKAAIVTVEDGEEKELKSNEYKLFDAELPIKDKNVKTAEAAGDDASVVKQSMGALKLYLMSDDSGKLTITEKKSGPLEKDDLNTKDAYIIHSPTCLYTWIGKEASETERQEAMRNAKGYAAKKEVPSNVPITRVIEGGEPTKFKALFKKWPKPVATGNVYSRNRIAKTVQTKFDASTMHDNRQLASETQMVDDGSGKYQIWRVQDFNLVALDKKYFGQFFGGDCYVIKYTYLVNGKENYILYFWLGAKSTADEQGTAAIKTVELDDEVGGAAVQIRVVQGKEPQHFMSIFGGKMIVYQGGKAGWTGGQQGNDGPGERYMLQVRGTTPLNTKAVQVDMEAASLNTNDVFVIIVKNAVYIWCGKGSTGDEREMAKNIASISPRDPVMVLEGKENKAFWEILGGKAEYATGKRLQDTETEHTPRLFQVSNASGNVKAEEISDFIQSDLVEDDVMLLDAFECIYLWIGKGANKAEKEGAIVLAKEYIESDPSGREKDIPIVQVKQGFEPPTFTGFFGVWDRDCWSKGKTYEELKQEFGDANVGIEIVKENMMPNGNVDFQTVSKYSLEELTVPPGELPSDVSPDSREVHLKDEEFEGCFKMKYSDFMKIPPWKQKVLKKNLGLF